jgi:hypothetical protein
MINIYLKYCLFVFICLSSISSAQNTSTYTRYGLGDILFSYSARTLSMGHSGSAILNSDHIEILNPASWSTLNRTRIEFSFAYEGMNLSDPTHSKTYGDGIFKGFTFAFPVSQVYGIGVALGIVPYSRLNYEVKEYVEDESTGNYTSTYQGKGGLSKFFLGTSYKLPIDLRIGATFEYYFGNIKYISKVAFDDNSLFPSEYSLTYGPTGFGTTIGLISPDMSVLFDSSSITNMRFGLSANIVSRLNTDTTFITTSSTIIDTLGIGSTEMKVPMKIGAGLHIELSKVYNFAVDYFYQPWTEFNLSGINDLNLEDVHKLSFGFEYKPQRAPGITFWEQIILRAGLSYEMSQYSFKGHDLTQYSAFTGFALPLGSDNTIDFAVEYSVRGTKDDNLLKENFIRLNLGISFGDIWFTRYEK